VTGETSGCSSKSIYSFKSKLRHFGMHSHQAMLEKSSKKHKKIKTRTKTELSRRNPRNWRSSKVRSLKMKILQSWWSQMTMKTWTRSKNLSGRRVCHRFTRNLCISKCWISRAISQELEWTAVCTCSFTSLLSEPTNQWMCSSFSTMSFRGSWNKSSWIGRKKCNKSRPGFKICWRSRS